MLRTIVEGEPGMFPDPVARLMRGIGGLFRRRPRPDAAADAPEAPADPPSGDAAGAPAADGATGPGGPDRAPGAEGR